MTNDEKKSNETAVAILKEYEECRSTRINFESAWQMIAERFWPNQASLFLDQNKSAIAQGQQQYSKVLDSTPSTALNRFSAIIDSILTPRNSTWHELVALDPIVKKDRDSNLWFQNFNRQLFRYRYAPLSNFSGQNSLDYKMIGAYGSGCMFIDDLKNRAGRPDGIRYKNMHLSNVYFKENHQGIIDTLYRYYAQKPRQTLQEWKSDDVPKQIRDAAASSPDKDFFFVHCVKPRADYDPKRVDSGGMPFISYYVSVEAKMVIGEGGYEAFPYSTSRWEQQPGEVYGRSIAMEVLPAVLTLMEQKRTVLKAGHKAVDPTLIGYDDGVFDMFSHRPGGLNSGGVTADGRPLIHALPVGDTRIGMEMMDSEKAAINDAFYITLFQILVETNTMTATEVLERTREKGILLAPPFGRIESEKLGSLIPREMDILIRQKKIPPPTKLILEAKAEYEVQYTSPFTRMARAEEAAGGLRTVEFALNVAAQTANPAVLDPLDFDSIIPELGEINGMPESWKASEEKIAEKRKARSDAAQEQQTINAAPGAAAMIKSTAVAKEAEQQPA